MNLDPNTEAAIRAIVHDELATLAGRELPEFGTDGEHAGAEGAEAVAGLLGGMLGYYGTKASSSTAPAADPGLHHSPDDPSDETE